MANATWSETTVDAGSRGAAPLPSATVVSSRVERSRAAVLDAATALLFEGGPAAVTIDAIVARSGVAKTTVYRHWANRDEVMAALFVHLIPRLDPPDPSLSFDDGMRALLRDTAAMMRGDGWRQVVAALLALKLHHPDMASIEEQMLDEQQAAFQQLFERGVAEGLVSPDDDPHVLITLAVGPLLMAGLAGPVPPSPQLADWAAEQFLLGQRARR